MLADENDVLFAQDTVWDVHLTFPYDNFIDSLLWTHDADSYLAATFQWEDVTVDSVGVKFKGNSSFQILSNKKSLKIDFNRFTDDQTFLELKKLNLNNCFKDPTFLREKLMIEIINQYVPSIRCSYARVYLNDHYWGLYTLVEQVDKTFCQSRFGSGEDGNLYKGDPHGTLRWQGTDPEPYRQNYEKVTNEDEDDWADLIDLIDILNNTPLESLDDSLGSRFQLVEWLKFIAVNNFLVSLDSYLGSGHNYFLYPFFGIRRRRTTGLLSYGRFRLMRSVISIGASMPLSWKKCFTQTPSVLALMSWLTSFGTTCTPIR
jgi:spore coat protein CotH